MFHPMVAGVTIPGMGIFVLILAPYIDRNPSNKPEDRKFAIVALHDLPHVLGRPRDHRLVLPRSRASTSCSRGERASSSTCDEAPLSAATVLAIAIPVIVLIAAIGVISAARRRDTSDATGSLSRETRRRDRGEPSTLPEPPPELTGREVEQAAAERAARRGHRGGPRARRRLSLPTSRPIPRLWRSRAASSSTAASSRS